MRDPRPPRSQRSHFLAAFFRHEAIGGILLIAAAIVALLIANSPWRAGYGDLLHRRLGPLSLELWIDDGLMALFFLGVGLEVKREIVEGALSHRRARMLPLVAAAAGMVMPALTYLLIARGAPGAAHGWAIPAATDIAFAQAILLLAGRGLPPSLTLFLTTVAVVDDIGAILIIALAYTAGIDWIMLGAAMAIVGALALLNRRGVTRLWPYLLLGALLWVAVFRSGIHATIAGVVTALFIPAGGGGDGSPLHRLERALHPWSAYLIVPLFGLANAGLDLSGIGLASLAAPIPLAVMLGLFLGKQAGIGIGTALALKLKLGRKPRGATPLQLYGVALLGGVGFTMSLFIGGLAFADPARFAEVKLGVLTGSLLSAAAGFLVLRLSAKRAPLSRGAARP